MTCGVSWDLGCDLEFTPSQLKDKSSKEIKDLTIRVLDKNIQPSFRRIPNVKIYYTEEGLTDIILAVWKVIKEYSGFLEVHNVYIICYQLGNEECVKLIKTLNVLDYLSCYSINFSLTLIKCNLDNQIFYSINYPRKLYIYIDRCKVDCTSSSVYSNSKRIKATRSHRIEIDASTICLGNNTLLDIFGGVGKLSLYYNNIEGTNKILTLNIINDIHRLVVRACDSSSKVRLVTSPNVNIENLYIYNTNIDFEFDIGEVEELYLDTSIVPQNSNNNWLGDRSKIGETLIVLNNRENQDGKTFREFLDYLIKSNLNFKSLNIKGINLLDLPDLSINPNFKASQVIIYIENLTEQDLHSFINNKLTNCFIDGYKRIEVIFYVESFHQEDVRLIAKLMPLLKALHLSIINDNETLFTEFIPNRYRYGITCPASLFTYLEPEEAFTRPLAFDKICSSSSNWSWEDLFNKTLVSQLQPLRSNAYIQSLYRISNLQTLLEFTTKCVDKGHVEMINTYSDEYNSYQLFSIYIPYLDANQLLSFRFRILRVECPSTKDIHYLLTPIFLSAKDAINWLNNGIDLKSFVSET